MHPATSPASGSHWRARGHAGLKDVAAGLVGSVVLIANIVSFGALMFPGEFSAGIPLAIWAMLIGSSIGGVCIALTTSLPPLATGIDSPTGAVLVLLSAAIASDVVGAGGSAQAAVQTIMLSFSAATLVSGAVLLALGASGWGSHCRFVPYFVIGGFLAATGWFLIAGGFRMTAGRALSPAGLLAVWNMNSVAKLAAAIFVLLALLAVRRWVKWTFALPVALLVFCFVAAIVLKMLGLTGREHGWYLPSLGALAPWRPFEAAANVHLSWPAMLRLFPELLAVTTVSLISLVTKVSSIEVARRTSGDLNREFRGHGIANLLAVPCGGLTAGMQIGTSRLLEHAGAATRVSGIVCAVVLGVVGISHFDLPGFVPIPIVAGLIFYLGYTFLTDALGRPLTQRAWLDGGLSLLIAAVCVAYGYLVGVLVGILFACVMFAISYARLGVVRRHVTRALFASYVERSPEATRHLRTVGDSIQLYWLSGYLFFGSSESVFERIRSDIEAIAPHHVAYVILDFSAVSGADSSAVASLSKLRNFCDKKGITLVYCSLSRANRTALERSGFFGPKSRHQVFADRNLALAWCEDRLLAGAKLDGEPDMDDFERWLQDALGHEVLATDLIQYLERKDATGPQVLYRQGEPADTVDFVAIGSLAIDLAQDNGESLRVRRITTHTVLGEMGFYRHSARSATVSSDGPATVFTLTRANFERMRRERPDLAAAFDAFIIRVLADRVDSANRAVVALSG